MRNFAQLAAVAAIVASQANAVCPAATASDCTDYPAFETAVATYANGYTWKFEQVTTSDDYILQMFRFVGDASGNPVAD